MPTVPTVATGHKGQAMTNKHTPGPWERYGHIGESGLTRVRACIGVDRVGRKQYQDVPINEDDASLIAVAPEMLEVCRLISRWMTGKAPGPHSDSALLETVNSVIRKAAPNQ